MMKKNCERKDVWAPVGVRAQKGTRNDNRTSLSDLRPCTCRDQECERPTKINYFHSRFVVDLPTAVTSSRKRNLVACLATNEAIALRALEASKEGWHCEACLNANEGLRGACCPFRLQDSKQMAILAGPWIIKKDSPRLAKFQLAHRKVSSCRRRVSVQTPDGDGKALFSSKGSPMVEVTYSTNKVRMVPSTDVTFVTTKPRRHEKFWSFRESTFRFYLFERVNQGTDTEQAVQRFVSPQLTGYDPDNAKRRQRAPVSGDDKENHCISKRRKTTAVITSDLDTESRLPELTLEVKYEDPMDSLDESSTEDFTKGLVFEEILKMPPTALLERSVSLSIHLSSDCLYSDPSPPSLEWFLEDF